MNTYVRLDTMELLVRHQLEALFSSPPVGFPPEADIDLLNFEGLTPPISILIEGPTPEFTFPDTVAPSTVTLAEDGYVYRSWVVEPAPLELWVEFQTEELVLRQRQANAQVTALQGKVTNLNWLINDQDPEDPDYIEPTPEEVAELPVRTAQLKAWNSYTTKLGRVKTQDTWPKAPVWPVMPEPYTSETSARSEA